MALLNKQLVPSTYMLECTEDGNEVSVNSPFLACSSNLVSSLSGLISLGQKDDVAGPPVSFKQRGDARHPVTMTLLLICELEDWESSSEAHM